MDHYRLLIPNGMTNNPFLFQMIRSLQAHPRVAAAQYGSRWLGDRSFRFDAVLPQWPEAMIDWKEPGAGDVERVREAFDWWEESGAAVVSTVHNTMPHFRRKVNEHTRALYRMVYGRSDAVVHLGEASRRLLKESVDYELDPSREVVIPHGNYEFFENGAEAGSSRRNPEWGEGTWVLSLGTIRSEEEMNLLKKASESIGRRGGTLLVAGRLPHTDRKRPGYWRTRLPLLFRRHLETEERFIPDHEVPAYLESADILLVPRIRSLNSGNVLLGYTFGKVVVGPGYGVVGEELRARGNPVFDPDSAESLEEAIGRAFDLLGSGLGEENRRFALRERRWEDVAGRYVALLNRLKTPER